MDTQNSAVADIPNFKLAKVGQDRKRRRGAGAWFGGGGGGSGSGLSGFLGGGAGAGAAAGDAAIGAGMTVGKILTILAISGAVSAGAWQFGNMMTRTGSAASGAPQKLFDSKTPQKYADTSGVIKENDSIPNSLGYVVGVSPEEKARRAAAAAAAQKAAEEAAAQKAAEEKQSASQQAATPDALDPTKLAKLDGRDAKNKKLKAADFKKMNSAFGSFGGGLAGGSGLSGGIGQSFGANANLGADLTKGAKGSLGAFNAKKSLASARPGGRNARAALGSGGLAKQQLFSAFNKSRQAEAASTTEGAATAAASPFDNNPGSGQILSGAGVGAGSGSGSAGSGFGQSDTGGPLNAGGSNCGTGQMVGANGSCQSVNSNSGSKSAPYQNLIYAVEAMMAIVSILALLAIVFRDTVYGWAMSKYLEAIIVVLGLAIAAMGAMIIAKSGDKMIGGIVIAVGAFTAASALLVPDKLTSADQIIKPAAGVLISNSLGALATSEASKTQLN